MEIEKIRLLPEQIMQIKKKIGDLEEMINHLKSKLDVDSQDRDYQGRALKEEVCRLDLEIRHWNFLLNSVEVIQNCNDETIDIGTRFAATLVFGSNDVETNEYILVSKREGKINDAMYVTLNSDFGKAVLGKKVGDPIRYSSSIGEVTGVIEEIIIQKGNNGIQKTK